MSQTTRRRWITAGLYALMSIILLICVFPVLWMCVIAIKTVGEPISGFHALRISQPTWANFTRLFELIDVGQHMYNSVFTTIIGTATTLFFCSLAGFAFAKYDFPGRDFLFLFVVATLALPIEVGAIPTFVIMRRLGLINSLWSLILPRMTTAIGIFYMRQYIRSVPDELIEAARIDGYGDMGIYLRVICPLIKPALVSWGSLTLIARWNDFFWPLLFLNTNKKYTLMVSVSMLPLSDGLATPWQVILAGTTLAIVPVVILYLFLQAFQKADLTAGAIKA